MSTGMLCLIAMIIISSLTGQASASTYIIIALCSLSYAHFHILILNTIKQQLNIANQLQIL
jgi:hypothetical protein